MPYLDIIILAAIFTFIAWKLWNTLGTTPDTQGQGSFLPRPKAFNNIVVLPGRKIPNSSQSLEDQITDVDSQFSIDDFLKGAKIFCQGVFDSKTEDELRSFKRYMSSQPYGELKKLMVPVLEEGATLGFAGCKVLDQQLEGSILDITLEISLKSETTPIKQVWIFRRNMTSLDPNWLLQNISSKGKASKDSGV